LTRVLRVPRNLRGDNRPRNAGVRRHLDVDPVALTVALEVDGVSRGTHAIPATAAPNADHFATLLAWEGNAEFDALRLERCAP
jgi:hypothetical protein